MSAQEILVAYGVIAGSVTQSGIIVMCTDVISGLAVIMIAMLMYPLFLTTGRPGSLVYLVLKYLEGILMIAGGILFLFPSTRHLRDPIYNNIHIYVFIVSAFLFYILLGRNQLVPRFITIWGMLGIGALSLSTILKLFQMKIAAVDMLLILIITNELFLEIWLFMKGFSSTESS